MKRLTFKQAFRYLRLVVSNEKLYYSNTINRGYLKEALSYLSRYSKSNEIVGAVKLIEIIQIIDKGHEVSASHGYPSRILHYEFEDRAERVAKENVANIDIIFEEDLEGLREEKNEKAGD